jgi:hypothetical protein
VAVPRRSLTLLRKLASRNGGIVDATVRDITAAWLQAWDELSPEWQQAIAAIIDRYATTGVWPAPWQVARIEAIARATARTERSLGALLTQASTATAEAAGRVSSATITAEPVIIASQSSAVSVGEVAVPALVVASALAARQNRIAALHRPIADTVLAAIRWEFTHPPTAPSGRRPAAGMQDRVRAGFGSGLTRATTIARTETIDTYRTAAQIVHTANPRVVTGWAWLCQCDLSSCPACWALHGTTHPLDEDGPASHGGCRCQRLPLVGDNSLPSAEARFRRLTRRQQLAVLGPARLEMLRSGQITWTDLAVRRSNSGWRDSYVPRTVADLRRIAGIRGKP